MVDFADAFERQRDLADIGSRGHAPDCAARTAKIKGSKADGPVPRVCGDRRARSVLASTPV